VPGISNVAARAPRTGRAASAPIEIASSPTYTPITEVESAYRPFSFQRDDYVYFIWHRIYNSTLMYRLADNGMAMYVKIIQPTIPIKHVDLAPYDIPAIPASERFFKLTLPFRCSPIDRLILKFTTDNLTGLRLSRCGEDEIGYLLT
jgi:hypothetical protein